MSERFTRFRKKTLPSVALLSVLGIAALGGSREHAVAYTGNLPPTPPSPTSTFNPEGGGSSQDIPVRRIVKELVPQVRVIDWNNYDFVGDPSTVPTVTKDVFVSILKDAHSPAAPMASQMYDAIVAKGVDPNLVLEIYFQESTYGTNGNYSHNVCNLRYAKGRPEWNGFANYRGYGKDGFVMAASDCAANIVYWHGQGKTDLKSLLYTLTPPSENDTASYLDGVEHRMKGNNDKSIALHPPRVFYRRYVDFEGDTSSQDVQQPPSGVQIAEPW